MFIWTLIPAALAGTFSLKHDLSHTYSITNELRNPIHIHSATGKEDNSSDTHISIHALIEGQCKGTLLIYMSMETEMFCWYHNLKWGFWDFFCCGTGTGNQSRKKKSENANAINIQVVFMSIKDLQYLTMMWYRQCIIKIHNGNESTSI